MEEVPPFEKLTLTPHKLSPHDRITVPAMVCPEIRTEYAVQNGTEKNILLRTSGDISDQICAEPILRYALNKFKDCKVSLVTDVPELFRHLKFTQVFDSKEVSPDYEKYLLFETSTIQESDSMAWVLPNYMLTNCVDYPSLRCLRLQLPTSEKEIVLEPKKPTTNIASVNLKNAVIVHPGKLLNSNFFWGRVVEEIRRRDAIPFLIGSKDECESFDPGLDKCIDFRDRLTLNDMAWLTREAGVLLTDDSYPFHMAASGKAWVGAVITKKHPDLLFHWRNGQWKWRETNFSRGGPWDDIDLCPKKTDGIEGDLVKSEISDSWLPDPVEMADWAVDRIRLVGIYD